MEHRKILGPKRETERVAEGRAILRNEERHNLILPQSACYYYSVKRLYYLSFFPQDWGYYFADCVVWL
jgi:hypothetical protein